MLNLELPTLILSEKGIFIMFMMQTKQKNQGTYHGTSVGASLGKA
jgi:hypothetical protein